MQLRELSEQSHQFAQAGISVHLISAETGGSDELVNRLMERGVSLELPVHSDPEHRLLLADKEGGEEDKHSFFVKRQVSASQYGGSYEDYQMVQPALVVVARDGSRKRR